MSALLTFQESNSSNGQFLSNIVTETDIICATNENLPLGAVQNQGESS